jgi:hypothetical protein
VKINAVVSHHVGYTGQHAYRDDPVVEFFIRTPATIIAQAGGLEANQ